MHGVLEIEGEVKNAKEVMGKTSTNCAELDRTERARTNASLRAKGECFIVEETIGSLAIPFWVSFAPSSGMPTDAASTMTADIVLMVSGTVASPSRVPSGALCRPAYRRDKSRRGGGP